MRMVVVVALAGAVVGCGADEAELGSTRGAIRDGVDDPDTVAVVGVADSETSGTCTGSLIAPNLVLTGHHCVAPIIGVPRCEEGDFGPARAASAFYVTTRPMMTTSPGDYHPVAEVIVAPGTGFCGRDVALLVLRANIDAAEAAPIAPRLDEPPVVGEFYSAVGFGGTADFGEGSGLRRRRDGLAVGCVGPGCPGAGDTEWIGEAGVCAGDSGGPALDDASDVIGVASRGLIGCEDPTYEGLVAHESWLRAAGERAATRGGYPAPAWVGLSTPDAGIPEDRDAGSGGRDAGGSDAGAAADGGRVDTGSPRDEGCGCHAPGASRGDRGAQPALGLLLLGLAVVLARVRAISGRATRSASRSCLR